MRLASVTPIGFLLVLSLLALGCTNPPQPNDIGNNTTTAGINGALNETANDSAPLVNYTTAELIPAQPKPPSVTCLTTYIECPDESKIQHVQCTNGKNKGESCKVYPIRDASDVPSTYQFYANYKCYWDLRDKYEYGKYFDPATVCQQAMIQGWDESCACNAKVDAYERAWGFANGVN